MFSDLPAEIKKMIFARVRLMDLYEVSGVSQEWWALTMATCSPTRLEYIRFLNYQFMFCNKMMPKEGLWQLWMFIEFTDEKSIELFHPPDKKMIEYLKLKGIRVRKLIYKSNPSIMPKLKVLFPYLQTLDFDPDFSGQKNGKAVVLPDGLKHLRLTINTSYKWSHLLNVFQHLERVDSLYVHHCMRINCDNTRFDKLKTLKMNMSAQSTKDIKSLVIGSKQLSSVSLENGLIDKEWLGLFPINIKKIQLKFMRLDKDIGPLFGAANAFVERQLMRFVCQDWANIRLFQCSDWFNGKGYAVDYVCRPELLEEELHIGMCTSETPCGLLETGKLQLKVLKLSEDSATKGYLNVTVPKSVEHFEWEANQYEAISFAALFEDISTLTKLRIESFSCEKILFNDFPHAASLVSLDISMVGDVILESILRNCPSLKELSLKWPQGMPFSKFSTELKSTSVKQLKIIEATDSITNILGHFPRLVDLHLQNVDMETVTFTDLTKLTSVEFVRINFRNINNLVTFNLVVNSLHLLSFPHVILGYLSVDPPMRNQTLSCVMGRKNAFFRRYGSLNWTNDFTKRNINRLLDRFDRLLYLKGISSLHIKVCEACIQVTYDIQEFIANALVKHQQEY